MRLLRVSVTLLFYTGGQRRRPEELSSFDDDKRRNKVLAKFDDSLRRTNHSWCRFSARIDPLEEWNLMSQERKSLQQGSQFRTATKL